MCVLSKRMETRHYTEITISFIIFNNVLYHMGMNTNCLPDKPETFKKNICPKCGMRVGDDEMFCDRYACSPSIENVISHLGVDGVYVSKGFNGFMALYVNDRKNTLMDQKVWSDRYDSDTMFLLEQLGVEKVR